MPLTDSNRVFIVTLQELEEHLRKKRDKKGHELFKAVVQAAEYMIQDVKEELLEQD